MLLVYWGLPLRFDPLDKSLVGNSNPRQLAGRPIDTIIRSEDGYDECVQYCEHLLSLMSAYLLRQYSDMLLVSLSGPTEGFCGDNDGM